MSIIDSGAKKVTGFTNQLKNPFSRSVKNTLRGNDFDRGFVFEELIGAKQIVKLLGNMMPKVPFTWGGDLGHSKEFYPGNPEPVVHVTHSEEADVTITGRFYDKKYPSEQALPSDAGPSPTMYGVAYEMAELIDKIRMRGNPLKIEMGEWQRYGFLTNTKFDMKRLGDIEYSLTFTIIGLRKPRNTQFLKKSSVVPFDVNQALIDKAQKFQSTYSTIPKEVPADIADILNDAISGVAAQIAVVTNFVDTTLDTIDDVTQGMNRATGLVKNAITTIQKWNRRVSQIPLSFTQAFDPFSSSKRPVGNTGQYKAAAHITATASGMNSLLLLMTELRRRFQALAKTVPLARYRVIDGDTLQKISMKFYEDSEQWKKIYDHNKLITTELESGYVLEIPKL